MMRLSVAAALLASCGAFAPKPLRGTPRRHAKRQSLQMNVITERPARAALAAAYVGFAGAIAAFPGEFNNPADIQLIQDALNDPTSMTVHKSNCYVRLYYCWSWSPRHRRDASSTAWRRGLSPIDSASTRHRRAPDH